MTAFEPASDSSHRYVLETVRQTDRDRFLAALFAPEPARRGLLALLAFDHELARSRLVTSEPMLARIRLQWWRDAVRDAARDAATDKPRAQPLVDLLSETMHRHDLKPESLIALIDAREEEIEGVLDVGRMAAALADLQLTVLGVRDPASRSAARAVASAWLMGEGPERDAQLAAARAQRAEIDPAALPVLLPALSIGREFSPWRRPLAYWWAAKRGRY